MQSGRGDVTVDGWVTVGPGIYRRISIDGAGAIALIVRHNFFLHHLTFHGVIVTSDLDAEFEDYFIHICEFSL